MTAERVRAQQAARALPGVRMVRVTVATVTPLTVTLPGGATVPAVKVAGLTYTVGAAAWAFVQEPAVGPVLPIA